MFQHRFKNESCADPIVLVLVLLLDSFISRTRTRRRRRKPLAPVVDNRQ
jgi:hypothetical protein